MYLVFDIGGTNTKIALSSDKKSLEKSLIIPTPQNFEEAIVQIKKAGTELAKNHQIKKVAGGVPGPLDSTKAAVTNFPNLHRWNNKPLKKSLEQAFGAEVTLANDAVIAGLGEANFGAGKHNYIVAFITIGTGLGGAKIVNGQLDKNSLGFEPGHQIIYPEGNLCGCGRKGHLEAYVSGSAIKKVHGIKAENISDPNIWDEISKTFAIGLNNTVVLWSPDIIVLGGSVSKHLPIQKVKAHLAKLINIFPDIPEIKLSTLKEEAGLYGALTLIK